MVNFNKARAVMTRKRQKARRHHGVGMDFHLGSVTNVVPDSDPSLFHYPKALTSLKRREL
jgi:hypothetical protein